MSNYAIRVVDLGKQYRIGEYQGRYKSLRDSLASMAKAPFRALQKRVQAKRNGENTIWALKDISFDIQYGEVVGIIGRNGAGKSTLLKVLARITEPSTGEVRVRGRVGSLLEVGTGFHPELTGRENIFLNGAILGMSRREIQSKFDEIVDFSEIERFIDTPAKYYSSGMYMRLAFSVAAHLEPEILLVDEVLAVGDLQFQKKCMGKMGEVANQGRTVLFVSHNMGAIRSLTKRCIQIDQGLLRIYDQTPVVIKRYMEQSQDPDRQRNDSIEFYRRKNKQSSTVKITQIQLDHHARNVEMLNDLSIIIRFEAERSIQGANITVVIKNGRGERVALIYSWDQHFSLSMEKGECSVKVGVQGLFLTPDKYFIDVGINQSVYTLAYDLILDYPLFTVDLGEAVEYWPDRPWGAIHIRDAEWNVEAN
jgi:lipopolysaccharide transport system ATP-binding protein